MSQNYRNHYYYGRYADAAIVGDAVGGMIGCLWPLIKRGMYLGLGCWTFYLILDVKNKQHMVVAMCSALMLSFAFIILATLFMKFSRAPFTYVFRAIWISFVQSWYPRIAYAVWLIAWLLTPYESYAPPKMWASAIVQLVALLFIGFYASFQFRVDENRVGQIASSFGELLGRPTEVFNGNTLTKVIYVVEIPHHFGAVTRDSELGQKIVARFPGYEVRFGGNGIISLTLIVPNHFLPIWKVAKAGSVGAFKLTKKGADAAKRKLDNDNKE